MFTHPRVCSPWIELTAPAWLSCVFSSDSRLAWLTTCTNWSLPAGKKAGKQKAANADDEASEAAAEAGQPEFDPEPIER
jgi:hypothetical protein